MTPFTFRAMQSIDLGEVMMIENRSHHHPWTLQNFLDCIDQRYWNYVLVSHEEDLPRIIGYCVVMPGVDELHLLNITIASEFRQQGIAFYALQSFISAIQNPSYKQFFLEVRKTNTSAIHLYTKMGFSQVGIRKDYYPIFVEGAQVGKEDAIVMSKSLNGASNKNE